MRQKPGKLPVFHTKRTLKEKYFTYIINLNTHVLQITDAAPRSGKHPGSPCGTENYTITSPDGTLQGTVAVDTEIRIALSADGKALLNPSPVAMTLAGGEVLGRDPRVVKAKKRSADETFDAHFYKKAQVRDHYNELALAFRGDYSLVVRLYDDGMAYRFETRKKGEITVENEQAEFNFPADFTTYAPYVYRTELRDSNGSSRTPLRTPTSSCP